MTRKWYIEMTNCTFFLDPPYIYRHTHQDESSTTISINLNCYTSSEFASGGWLPIANIVTDHGQGMLKQDVAIQHWNRSWWLQTYCDLNSSCLLLWHPATITVVVTPNRCFMRVSYHQMCLITSTFYHYLFHKVAAHTTLLQPSSQTLRLGKISSAKISRWHVTSEAHDDL